jgi:Ras-related protein Rab-28
MPSSSSCSSCYQVVVVGDGAAGKTSLCMRFCENNFAKQYKQTIGLDFFIKRLLLPNETHVTLQIWDIGGQSIGSKMLSKYVFGADAILFLYDLTNKESFKNIEDWLDLIKKTFPDTPPVMALLGNKCTLVVGMLYDSSWTQSQLLLTVVVVVVVVVVVTFALDFSCT